MCIDEDQDKEYFVSTAKLKIIPACVDMVNIANGFMGQETPCLDTVIGVGRILGSTCSSKEAGNIQAFEVLINFQII